MRDKIQFEYFEQHIKIEILKKMTLATICQMRKTSSLVEQLVSQNRKKFSSCTKLGVNIYITRGEETAYVEFYEQYRKKYIKLDSLDFERELSGVAIKHFYIELYERGGFKISRKIFNILEKLQPICETIEIRHFENNMLCKMLKFFTIRDKAVIVPQDHHIDNQLFDKCIANLNEMPMKQQIAIQDTIVCDNYVEGLFAKVTNFREFGFIVSNAEVFKTFFYEMYKDKQTGNLNRVCCDITDAYENFEKPILCNDVSNFHMLWNSESLPENDRSNLMFHCGLPVCVRKLELVNKFAIVIENAYPCFSYEVLIVIVEKSSLEVEKALMDALRLSHVDEEFLEKYNIADNKEKNTILTEAIMRKAGYGPPSA